MKIHRLSAETALGSLQSSPSGLTTDEARRRLAEYGPNAVPDAHQRSLAREFAREFTHFFALMLWIAAALAFFAEAADPGQGMAALGGAIVGVIIVNGLFSFWQTYRAERALRALRLLLPHRTTVVRDGTARQVPSDDLVPGDVVVLEAGDLVPADCRVIEAFGLRVDNSTVTGESVPHARDAEPDPGTDLASARNTLLAGTSVASGEAHGLVFATGEHTAFGRIAILTQTTGETLSPLQREITHVSRLLSVIAMALGGGFFLVGQAVGLPFWAAFMFAIGIIVANVPEGLLPTVTLALAMGSQRMARRQALVRRLPAVEALGCATVICTDKTGTLTENRMTARTLYLDGRVVPADGAEAAQLASASPRFFEIAACCHELKAASEAWLGDPLEVALVHLAARSLPALPAYRRVNVVPFDSRRRRLSTVHATGDAHLLFCKGAPEVVLPRCTRCEDRRPYDVSQRETGQRTADAMAHAGLRVLALAWRLVPGEVDPAEWEEEMTFSGLVGFEDPPRPEVPAAIRQCAEAGVRVIMITGDHPETATAIAREIGLVTSAHPTVLTGEKIQHLSDTQLQIALDQPEILFARVAAEQKMRIVAALKRKREVVAVTGDGVNDAPALRRADVGIAMGRSGTDVARETADLVLLDDNFATIVAAIREGRAVFANVRKFLTYILTSNVPEIVPYLAFVLFRIPLPLTVMQILAVDLGTDMVPALALGAEPAGKDLMRRPPRPSHERLLTRALLARAYLFLGPMQAVAAMAAYFFVLRGGDWQPGIALAPDNPLYRQATTACLAAIIVMQIVNVFLCRSDLQPAFGRRFFENPLILVGITSEIALILIIVYTPLGHAVFATHPLPPGIWLFTLPFAIGMALAEEIRKAMMRRRLSLPLSTRPAMGTSGSPSRG